jgi:hypothetical protein
MPNSILLNIKEVLRLAAFAAGALAVALLVMSAVYEIFMRSQHSVVVQHERFMQKDVQPSVVFLGDSRGVHALHHGSLSKAFYNYSHFGEYPYQQILRARHVLRDKPSVRVLVMQMDPYVVMEQRAYRPLGESRGFYESLLFTPLSDVYDIVSPSPKDMVENILTFVFPLKIYWERTDLWGAIRNVLTGLHLDSAQPRPRYFTICGDIVNRLPTLSELNKEELMSRAKYFADYRYKNNRFAPEVGKLYTDFIAEAAAKNVRVIGIRFPEISQHVDATQGQIDVRATSFLTGLGVTILDYRDLLSDRPDLYTDPDHLTDEGARLMSDQAAVDLTRLLGLSGGDNWFCSSTQPASGPTLPYEALVQRTLM